MRSMTHAAGALAASTLLLLTGCGQSADSAPAADAADTSTAADGLTLQDGWVKAAPEGMTAAFGTLRNDTAEDIHLTRVTADAAPMAELHVTVDDGTGTMVMQEAPDGFVVPAGGEHQLTPGGDHLMLMGLNEPLESGTTTRLDVTADDGQDWAFELPVREFTGAEESYQPGSDEQSPTREPDDTDTDTGQEIGSAP